MRKNILEKYQENKQPPCLGTEAAAFLRGEIESGISSIQDLLYRENVCKVCLISKRNGNFLNKS